MFEAVAEQPSIQDIFITPIAGSIAFPLIVPLLMLRVGIGAGVLAVRQHGYAQFELPDNRR